jgi:hypothetical protein
MPRVKLHRFAGREFRVNTMLQYHHITVVPTRVETRRTWRVSIEPNRHTSYTTRAKDGVTQNTNMPKKMEAFICALLAMKGH